jgi:hypothetical protein
MAYKVIPPGRKLDIPDEQLDHRIVHALKYFEKLFAETYVWRYGVALVTWDEMRPRMIRVLYDAYGLTVPGEEPTCTSSSA